MGNALSTVVNIARQDRERQVEPTALDKLVGRTREDNIKWRQTTELSGQQYNRSGLTQIVMYIIAFIIIGVVVLVTWVIQKAKTTSKNVNRKINSMPLTTPTKDENTTIKDSTDDDPTGMGLSGTYSLRDYYIFSSYNSCNNNNTTTNNNVDTQSLKNVIAQGARLLDFEIYSIENEPIVATSSIPNNYYIKESNSSVLFRNVFDTIINTAFNISTSPNPTDPLFVQLRIQSTNQKMFSNMALIIKNYENSGYILGPEYSFEYQECKDSNGKLNCTIRNITSEPLNKFKSKIIIMIDKQNTNVLDNKDLMEFCNMTTSSTTCRLLTNYDMRNSPDQNELIEFNKKSMSIVTPDIGTNPSNPNISTSNLLGIQMTAINFSNEDEMYDKTVNFFSDNGTAFVLKPENLRYRPMYIAIPNNPPASYSFAPRDISSRYYNFNM
jgi:hypothetical protein